MKFGGTQLAVLFFLSLPLFAERISGDHRGTGISTSRDGVSLRTVPATPSPLETINRLDDLAPKAASSSLKWSCENNTLTTIHDKAFSKIAPSAASASKELEDSTSSLLDTFLDSGVTVDGLRTVDSLYRSHRGDPEVSKLLNLTINSLVQEIKFAPLAVFYADRYLLDLSPDSKLTEKQAERLAAAYEAGKSSKAEWIKRMAGSEIKDILGSLKFAGSTPLATDTLIQLALSDDAKSHDLFRRLILFMPDWDREELLKELGSCPLMQLPENIQSDEAVQLALSKAAPKPYAEHLGQKFNSTQSPKRIELLQNAVSQLVKKNPKFAKYLSNQASPALIAALPEDKTRGPFRDALALFSSKEEVSKEELAIPKPVSFSTPPRLKGPTEADAEALLASGFSCPQDELTSDWRRGYDLLNSNPKVKADFIRHHETLAGKELNQVLAQLNNLFPEEKLIHLDDIQKKHPFTLASKKAALLSALIPELGKGISGHYAREYLKQVSDKELKELPESVQKQLGEVKGESPLSEVLRLSMTGHTDDLDLSKRVLVSLNEKEFAETFNKKGVEKPGSYCWAGSVGLREAIKETNISTAEEWRGLSDQIKALGKASVPALLNAFGSDETPLVRFSLEQMSHLGPEAKEAAPTLIEALERLPSDRRLERDWTAQVLGRIGTADKNVVPALIKALNGDNYQTRASAGHALTQIGRKDPEAIKAVLKALKEGEVPTKISVAEGIGTIKPPLIEAEKDLLALMKNDRDLSLVITASRALAEMGLTGKEYLANLEALIKAPSESLRGVGLQSAKSLGAKGKALLPLIKANLGNKSSMTRIQALEAYLMLESDKKELNTELLKHLNDPDADTQSLVIGALSKNGTKPEELSKLLVAVVENKTGTGRTGALFHIGTQKKEAVTPVSPRLAKLIADDDQEIRLAAANTLRELGPLAENAIPEVTKLLENGDPQVPLNAISVIVSVGTGAKKTKEVIPALMKLAQNKKAALETPAIIALGALEAEEAIPLFIKGLDEENGDLRSAFAFTLPQLGPKAKSALPALKEALKIESHEKAKEAMELAIQKLEKNN